jgi:DNA polymerase III alpha subunit
MYDFIEVLEVEEIAEQEDTYDITVENTHNFFANGMLVHNCLGGVYAGCYWENKDKGEEAILDAFRNTTKRMNSIFGDRWYGELQWNNVPEQHILNKYIIKMQEEFGIGLVSTCDSHYPNPNAWKDRELYKRLGWLGKGKPEWAEGNSELPAGVDEIGYELYPKNGDQMFQSYQKYSKECNTHYQQSLVLESITNSYKIAHERIENFMPDTTVRLPEFVVPAGFTAGEALRHYSMEGMRNLGLLDKPNYIKQLDQELDVIEDRGFSKYFLTMKAISDRAQKIQLVGAGRGSGAGSLVAYVLGITQVDPIKHELMFERFMTSNRDKMIGVFTTEETNTKQITDVIKVTTDEGKVIELSPKIEIEIKRDNKILFVKAKELIFGDEILFNNGTST